MILRKSLSVIGAITANLILWSGASAVALTPELYPLLFGGIKPVYQWNALTSPAVPSFLSLARTNLPGLMMATSGYFTYAPNSLSTYNNTMSNAAWTKNANVSITDNNATAPDGTTTAGTVTLSATGANYAAAPMTALAGIRYLLSFYAKTGTAGSQQFDVAGSNNLGHARWNPTNQVVTLSTDWVASSGGMTSLSNSWFLNWAIFNSSTANAALYDLTNNVAGTALYWHTNISAVTYETSPRSQDQVVTTSAAYFGPACDNYYSSGSIYAQGCRAWASTTNSAKYSNAFSSWTATNATLAQNAAGPDGQSSSAWTWTASSTTSTLGQSISLSAGSTYSLYIAAGTANYVYIETTDAGGVKGTWFATSGCASSSANTTVSGSPTVAQTALTAQSISATYCRIGVSNASAATTAITFGISDASGSTAVTSGKTVIAFQADAVQGVSAFQPPIPTGTGGSSVTAAADTWAGNGVTLTNYPVVVYTASTYGGASTRTCYAKGAFVWQTNVWYRQFKVGPSTATCAQLGSF